MSKKTKEKSPGRTGFSPYTPDEMSSHFSRLLLAVKILEDVQVGVVQAAELGRELRVAPQKIDEAISKLDDFCLEAYVKLGEIIPLGTRRYVGGVPNLGPLPELPDSRAAALEKHTKTNGNANK
jgi:hypothetical protein